MQYNNGNSYRPYNSNNQRKGFKWSSPYNFVPVHDGVLIPWWYDIVSQDIPLEDAESGKMLVELTNLTPLCIREGGERKKEEYAYSAHVDTKEGKLYFIPGSSIKGMLRSVAEILSFSRLSQLNNVTFKKKTYSWKEIISQLNLDDCGSEDEGFENPKDMAETLFGYVDDKESLKGRVWFGNAFASSIIKDANLVRIAGVLGEPKASFYPFYLEQQNPKYITYEMDGATLSGRKRYRIHENRYITKLPEGNKNDKVLSKLMLLPVGTKFRFSISFHNLMPEEIGLLFSALTFHGTTGAYHNIGAAKSFGYGKIDVSVAETTGLKHSKEYYMEFFERYINNFTWFDVNLEKRWKDTMPIKRLIEIASEHKSGLEMMNLKEYNSAKQNSNKDKVLLTLKEEERQVHSFIPKDDLEKFDLFDMELHKALKSKIIHK